MMAINRFRKITQQYYFSVEGQTEKWYFEWLQRVINENDEAVHKVNFDIKIEKNPISFAKRFSVLGNGVTVWHVFDFEGNDNEKQFQDILDMMRKVQGLGKNIVYKSGYSNLSFDLWMILHKADCCKKCEGVKDYSAYIRRIYGFSSMDDYKKEDNFKRCLKNLQLSDVRAAIKRAECIKIRNDKHYNPKAYRKYSYFEENPALDIYIPIKEILMKCKLL